MLSFSFVNANHYWRGEANAGYEFEEDIGVESVGYGSNYVNPESSINGSDYSLCAITKSDYTPIVSNFGNLGSLKVVVTDKSNDKLTIYNPDCSIFREIYVSGDIVAMPTLSNAKSYYDQKIVVLTEGELSHRFLKVYHYERPEINPELGDFVLESSKFIDSYPDLPRSVTCLENMWGSDEFQKCVVIGDDDGDSLQAFVFNMDNNTYSYNHLYLNYGLNLNLGKNGLSSIRTPSSLLNNEKFYVIQPYYSPLRSALLQVDNMSAS